MPLLQGVLGHIERDSDNLGSAARAAYIADHPSVAGRYILSDTSGEATAFLQAAPIASALGRFILNDDSAEQDRALYQTTPTRVVI